MVFLSAFYDNWQAAVGRKNSGEKWSFQLIHNSVLLSTKIQISFFYLFKKKQIVHEPSIKEQMQVNIFHVPWVLQFSSIINWPKQPNI